MKKRSKWMLAGALLFAAALCLAGCTFVQPPYPDYDEQGYNVSVRYDCSGGVFANTQNTTLVDVFKPAYGSDGTANITLLAPGDEDRGTETSDVSVPSNSGYFLAGWYRTRELRFASDGTTPLDAYGNPLSQDAEGNWIGVQGYVFSDPWDFETDTLTVYESEDYTSSEPALTLYAAWIPNFVFNFYAPNAEQEWEVYATASADTVAKRTLNIPSWNEETGGMNYTDYINTIVPARTDMTFEAASLTEDFSEELTSGHSHPGTVDYAAGVGQNFFLDVYTTWIEGEWYQIRTADQFINAAAPGRCYEILADLDFTDKIWPTGLETGTFTGRIIGNDHTFSNITFAQSGGPNQTYGGLFGRIDGTAHIENVTFANVTYTVGSGSRMMDSSFGLFTGYLSVPQGGPSPLANVTLSGGTLIIGDVVPPATRETLYGLFSGNLVSDGATVDLSSIVCYSLGTGYDDYGKPVDTYPFILDIDRESGRITLTVNRDPTQDPNGAPVSPDSAA